MTSSSTIVLFDIDGTLVATHGVGRRALVRAFREVVDGHDPFPFPFDGMTDRAIVRRALRALGAAETTAVIEAILESYVRHLEAELYAGDPFVVYHGVSALIDACEAAEFAVGLGTGNVERGAHLKLTPVNLAHRFRFGGYGSDHEDRSELIRIGAERGARALGLPLSRCRVVVIGDTPSDIEAACAIDAECIAVATGRFSVDALTAAGASCTVETLADPTVQAHLFDQAT